MDWILHVLSYVIRTCCEVGRLVDCCSKFGLSWMCMLEVPRLIYEIGVDEQQVFVEMSNKDAVLWVECHG